MTLLDDLLKDWNINCIIFDLDGTLIDTLDKHIQAFQLLFEKLAYEIPLEQIAENMGRTPKDTLLSLLPELSKNKKRLNELANKKEEILSELLDVVPKLAGALDILRFVEKLNLKICLASSTPKYNVTKMLKIAGIDSFFDVIITGEDITIGKPNPEVFLKAAEKAGIVKGQCLVIGDSPHDIMAAKNASMKVIAVTTGKHSYQEIKDTNPDMVISTLNELLV